MLAEEMTYGAIVYGIQLDLSEFVDADDTQSYVDFNNLVSGIDGITHFVPGDSHYVEIDCWCPETLLGVAAAMVSADAAPLPFDPASVDKAKADFEKALSAIQDIDSPIVQAALEEGPKLFIAAIGPLPYASLDLGQLLASGEIDEDDEDYDEDEEEEEIDPEEAAIYEFLPSQNTSQEWRPFGVDGISLAAVEFTDTEVLDLAPERLERWKERVSEFEEPKFYLSVRYD